MIIREASFGDIEFLLEMTLEAAFPPTSSRPNLVDALKDPRLSQWVTGFGSFTGDMGVIAKVDSKPVGAAWSRRFDTQSAVGEVGLVDESIPAIAIAVDSDYRSQGIGGMLLESLFSKAKSQGFDALSLAVSKANKAIRLYTRSGFKVVRTSGSIQIMLVQIPIAIT